LCWVVACGGCGLVFVGGFLGGVGGVGFWGGGSLGVIRCNNNPPNLQRVQNKKQRKVTNEVITNYG